jgi:hypothetical protein
MLGDGGQGHLERGGQLGDGSFSLREALQDPSPGGIGEGREGRVERASMLNHMVK